MAKIFGLNGVISGKIGNTVMAVRNGMQLARQYNPIVSNPNSEAQIAQRAKLKLMSQLSAVMGPYIAIPRQGTKSARNLFVKENFPLSSYSENQASISLVGVSLTKSVVGLPSLTASRSSGVISVSLATVTFTGVNRIVYVGFARQSDGALRYQGQQVVSERGESGNWPASIYAPDDVPVVIYAYGIRDNTNAAIIRFGNIVTLKAETIAKLIVSRNLLESDVTLTETNAIDVAAV